MHILKELTVIMNKEKIGVVDMSLEEMRDVDIRQVDRSSLADLRDIHVKKDSHNQPDSSGSPETDSESLYVPGGGDSLLHLITQIMGKQWMIRLL